MQEVDLTRDLRDLIPQLVTIKGRRWIRKGQHPHRDTPVSLSAIAIRRAPSPARVHFRRRPLSTVISYICSRPSASTHRVHLRGQLPFPRCQRPFVTIPA